MCFGQLERSAPDGRGRAGQLAEEGRENWVGCTLGSLSLSPSFFSIHTHTHAHTHIHTYTSYTYHPAHIDAHMSTHRGFLSAVVSPLSSTLCSLSRSPHKLVCTAPTPYCRPLVRPLCNEEGKSAAETRRRFEKGRAIARAAVCAGAAAPDERGRGLEKRLFIEANCS